MFVTLPQFEQTQLSKMAGQGQKYWRAITAAFPVEPWYLVVYRGQVADRRVDLTLLVAWEESLLDLIDQVPIEDRRCAYRVEAQQGGGLVLRTIYELWTPSADEAEDGLAAIFGFGTDGALVDERMRAVPADGQRRLVYRAPFH